MLLAVIAADGDPEIEILDVNRLYGMGDPGIAGIIDPLAGAEGPGIFLSLCALIDQ
jgi:hypothetical protein